MTGNFSILTIFPTRDEMKQWKCIKQFPYKVHEKVHPRPMVDCPKVPDRIAGGVGSGFKRGLPDAFVPVDCKLQPGFMEDLRHNVQH